MKISDYQTRLLARLERLGSAHPVCVVSGEDDPMSLELHHITYGRGLDDVEIVSATAHSKLSDKQKSQPPQKSAAVQDRELYQVGRYLCGLADMLELMVETQLYYGKFLMGLAAIRPLFEPIMKRGGLWLMATASFSERAAENLRAFGALLIERSRQPVEEDHP